MKPWEEIRASFRFRVKYYWIHSVLWQVLGLLSIGIIFFFRMLYAQYGLIGLKFFP